jgi:hypothetical protein
MCMALYLGSDQPIPLMPWEEGRSPIWTRTLADDDDAVRAKFSKKHVCYVGAWEGCGCGFQYGTLPDVDEGDEHEAQCRSSVEALRTLLSERPTSSAARPSSFARERSTVLRRPHNKLLERPGMEARADFLSASAGRSAPDRYTDS